MKNLTRTLSFAAVLAFGHAFGQQLNITTQITNPSCNSINDGEIRIIFDGGTAPYFVDGVQITGSMYTAEGLFQGEYEYTVSDNANNSQQLSIPLIAPPAVQISGSITHVSSLGSNDGAINITIPVPVVSIFWFTPEGSGLIEDQEDQTGLSPGVYAVVVTEASGCESAKRFEVVVNPAPGPGPSFPSFEPNVEILNGLNTSEMIVYPNPSEGKVTIESKTKSVTVVSETGLLIGTYQFNDKMELDLKPGTYFIHSYDETGKGTTKRVSIR